MIVVNFKAYSQSTGEEAEKLARECEKAMQETGKKIVVAPSAPDLLRTEGLEPETFSQHFDPVGAGSHTGSTNLEEVAAAGAEGTLLNHSEQRMEEERLEKAVEKAREAGLTTVVCAQDPEECGRFSRFNPDFIAYEPPELIGGEVSVSEAKPELIEEAVEKSEAPVLTGAGIKKTEDVRKSIKHGCEGVLVASGVVKADKPREELKELAKGL
ncbi:MAG: triose-phosphate isomerase [Candidatus Nanohaloarchaea archaeon]